MWHSRALARRFLWTLAAPVRHRPVTVQRLAGATERMARMLWRDAAENQ
jgi:hypothetical protein